MLPASIQVCPIEIPGRGRRSLEPSIDNVHRLADMLASNLPLQVRSMRRCVYSTTTLGPYPFTVLHLHVPHDPVSS